MTEVLLKHAARAMAPAVGIAFFLSWFVFGESAALGAVVGGLVAVINFLAVVYTVGKLLDTSVGGNRKLGLMSVLFLKLAVAAVVLWWAVGGDPPRVDPIGVVFAIGAAIAAFVFGLTRAMASEEGQLALKAEQAKIAQQMGEED